MNENPNVRLLAIITGRGRETSTPRVAGHLHHAATFWETDTPIANLQKMAVAERREAQSTTGRRNEDGLAVRQATIKLLAESCRQ